MLNKDKDYNSYSSILRFIEEGPKSLITERKKSSKGLSQGKALDDYIYDDFDKKYYISDIDVKLTSMENTLLELIEKNTAGVINQEILNSPEFVELCNDTAVEAGLFKSDRTSGSNTIKDERIDNIKLFILDNIKSKGKKIITSSFYIDIVNMANKLKNNQYTEKFFNNKNIEIYQNLNQIVLEFEYEGFKFKSVVDNIHINHNKKTIQINDLKFTSFKTSDFIKSFFKYRYDIQACLYTIGLKCYVDEKPELKDYAILEPSFIIVNKDEEPVLYKVERKDIVSTWLGWDNRDERYFKGIKDYLKEIQEHIEKDLYDYPIDYYKRGLMSIQTGRANYFDGRHFSFVKQFSKNLKKGEKEKSFEEELRDVPQEVIDSSINVYSDADNVHKRYKDMMEKHQKDLERKIGINTLKNKSIKSSIATFESTKSEKSNEW